MLTKNFAFLKDEKLIGLKNLKEIILGIEKIENQYRNKDFNLIPSALGKILETIIDGCSEYHENIFTNLVNSSLHEKIKIITDEFLGEDDRDVRDAFFQIKNARNKAAHRSSSDNLMIVSIVVLLSQIQIILKFYILRIADITLAIPSFDEHPYLNKEFIPNTILNSRSEEKEIKYKAIEKEAMNANIIPIIDLLFLKNLKFKIPIYQRGYAWNDEHLRDLIKDIFDRKNDGSYHFFGNIACKKNENNPNEVVVLDGQQRLTTSILIMIACWNILKKYSKKNWIESDYLKRLNGEKLSDIFERPDQTQESNEIFKKILDRKELKEIIVTEKMKKNPYFSNFEFLISNIEKNISSYEDIEEFTKTFTEKFLINFLELSNNHFSVKKEMEVFENLNTKGTSLTASQIIKNYFFSLCSQDELKPENEGKIAAIYTLNLWDENDVVANKKNKETTMDSSLEEFYIAFIHYRSGREVSISKTNRHSSIFNSFKTEFEQWIIEKNIVHIPDGNFKKANFSKDDFSKVMLEIGKLYKYFLSIKFYGKSFSPYYGPDTDMYRSVFDIINKSKFTPIYPAMFLLIEKTNFLDLRNSSKDEKRIVREYFLEIIKVLIKHQIIKGQGDSEVNRNFYVIYKKISDTKKSFTINEITTLMSNELNALYSKDQFIKELEEDSKITWAVRALLVLTEKSLCGESTGCSVTHFSTPEVEHIMPQSWSGFWEKDIIEWNDLKQENRSTIDNLVAQNLNMLGNFVILNGKKNKEVRNGSFAEKQKKLLQESSALYKNTNKKIDISQRVKWSFNDIKERTQELIEYIKDHVIIK